MKRATFLFLLALMVLILPASLKRCTHSFHISRLQVDLPEQENWKTISRVPKEEVLAILSQPFTYLSRGSQAFVFASQDGKYVLKLFLFDIKDTLLNRVFHREEMARCANVRSAKTLDSLAMADHYFSQHTGIIYSHLNLDSDHLSSVLLRGPAWHRAWLDLNRVRFVLQVRAQPLAEPLMDAYRDNDRERFDRLIWAIDALLSERIECQIRNSDPTLFDNFGFRDEQALEIDFGNYTTNPSVDEKTRYTEQLLKWAEKNTPRWKEDVAAMIRESP